MSAQIQDFLNKNPELLDNPEKIKSFSIKESVDLIENFNHIKQNPSCSGLMIESLSVINRFKKNKIIFNQLKDSLLLNSNLWVTEEELKEIENNFFSLNKKISETEINESILWQEIENIRKQELKNFIEKTIMNEIEFTLNDDFKKRNTTLSLFLRKKVLDNVSLEMFGKVNAKVNQLFSISKIDKHHFLNENNLINKKETVFAYINLNRMESPKIPRFGSIFDPYEVHHYKVKNVFHRQVKSKVCFEFEHKKIIVNCDIWLGNIVCEE